MRMLEILEREEFHADAVHQVLARMFYPDDDISAKQVIAVMRLETERKNGDPRVPQGDIMRTVESKLLRYQTLGRMVGDIAIKMEIELNRGGNASLEFASTFISEYYTSEEMPGNRYPTDARRLQQTFRRLKNSAHYWAAWQLCQGLDGFDFLRAPGNLWQLLLQAGLVQIALAKLKYFEQWDPWLVPVDFIQTIERQGLLLSVPEETEFEREFARTYRSKLGR